MALAWAIIAANEPFGGGLDGTGACLGATGVGVVDLVVERAALFETEPETAGFWGVVVACGVDRADDGLEALSGRPGGRAKASPAFLFTPLLIPFAGIGGLYLAGLTADITDDEGGF